MSRIEQHWYQPHWALTLLLWPLALLFAGLAALRRMAYRWQWCKSVRLPVPVVVIGNINVGGVGKTPLAVALIQALREKGLQVGVVSRGYGGSATVPVQVLPDSPVALVGDESLLLAATGAPVVVGRDRVAAAQCLLARYPDLDLLLTDDGLQHYRLARNLEIVVLDGQRGLGNQRLLPAGPLREPVSRLEKVDAIVINGPAAGYLPLPPGIPVFAMQLHAGPIHAAGDPQCLRSPADFAGQRVAAMAGIGHPQRFFNTIRQLGIVPVLEQAWPDHHVFSAADLPVGVDAILVTAKDAVKLQILNHDKLWVIPVSARLAPDLADWILARLKAD